MNSVHLTYHRFHTRLDILFGGGGGPNGYVPLLCIIEEGLDLENFERGITTQNYIHHLQRDCKSQNDKKYLVKIFNQRWSLQPP